jgi:hypothetical protein
MVQVGHFDSTDDIESSGAFGIAVEQVKGPQGV